MKKSSLLLFLPQILILVVLACGDDKKNQTATTPTGSLKVVNHSGRDMYFLQTRTVGETNWRSHFINGGTFPNNSSATWDSIPVGSKDVKITYKDNSEQLLSSVGHARTRITSQHQGWFRVKPQSRKERPAGG